MNHFSTLCARQTRALLTLLSCFALLTGTWASAEGSFQTGTNQYLYEYISNNGLLSNNLHPLYIELESASEVVNISLCSAVNVLQQRSANNTNNTYIAVPGNVRYEIYTENGLTQVASGSILRTTEESLCASDLNSGTLNPPADFRWSPSDNGRGAGTYQIRLFDESTVTCIVNASGDPCNTQNVSNFARFDISVTSSKTVNPNPRERKGRLFAYNWAYSAYGFGSAQSTDADYFVLVPGGRPNSNFVWQLDLNNFAGFVYDIVANPSGVDAENVIYSVPFAGNSVTEVFPIYLGYPGSADSEPAQPPQITNARFTDSAGVDQSISPDGTAGVQDTGTFFFTSDVTGTHLVVLDINKDGTFGNTVNGVNDVYLFGLTQVGNNEVVWDGTDNQGDVVPDGTYQAQLQVRMGEYHFVAGDAETSGGNGSTANGNGLTIYRATSNDTLQSETVYWDDITGFVDADGNPSPRAGNGGSTLPDGEASVVGDPTGPFRHTWGDFDGSSFGNQAYVDTYVFGLSSEVVVTSAVNSNSDDPVNLGLAKDAAVSDNQVTLDFYLENFSNSTLTDLTLTDDLDAVFGAGNYTVSSPPTLISSGANSTVNVNPDFNGSADQALLAADSDLAPSETAQVQVGVTVNTLSNQGVYSNTATASAQTLDANGNSVTVTDNSTNGTDPDVDSTESDGVTADGGAGDNDNNANPLDNSEPTPIIVRYDYGDAPADLSSVDASMNPAYPTLKEDNGAVHTVDGVTFLGSGVTAELDGQPTLEANGDTDDGVSFPLAGSQPVLIANINQPNVITVNASTDGFLNVWIDNNQDGDFTDAGEQIFTNEALSAGNNTINYTPTNTQPHGETYLRFRFTSASMASPSPAGSLPDGEVEDYRVNIVLPQPATCEVGLVNSSFETPTVSGSTIRLETAVPGWSFRASDPAATFPGVDGFTARNSIEIWRGGFSNVPAYEGNQFAEINAYVFGELYQELVTAPGSVLTYQFAHRGRNGNDTIDVLIGSSDNLLSQSPQGNGYTSPNTEWRVYTGTYTVPPGQTVTRFAFRALNSAGGNGASGNFLDAISFGISCDYGDAPLSYGEASHITSDLKLGALVDSEGETLLDSDDGDGADGDDLLDTDDEDGVAISTLAAGSSTDITISASEAGRLDAWIDWNGDGDFADAGEQIATNQALSAGDNTLSVAVPNTATLGTTYGRFRISSAGSLTASGSAPDGEVEDYALEIVGVDLSLTKEVGNASPVAGEEVTFTLTLTNNSPDAATNVEVTDLLPNGLTFVPPSPPSTVYDETTGVWNVGTLAGDSSTTLDITATVDANGPVTLTNTAEVTATDQQDPNSAPNNRNDEPGEDDTASATLNVYRVSPSKGDIIINEVLFDQSSSSISAANNDEFIELYNAGNTPVDLSGWQLIDANLITDDENGFDGPNGNINGTVPYTFPNAQLAPGEYAIIWIGERTIERDAPSAGFQAWLESSARLSNTGDDVWLYDAETRIVDYVAYGTNTGGKNPINPPPPASLNLWDDTYNPDLDNTEKGQSISLTPNGVDSDSSACWEPTTSGDAETRNSPSCPNYLPTTDSDARTIDGTPLITSVAQNNNAFEQRITGTLFYDDGLTGGVANNALQEVGEQGVSNVVVTATDGTNTVSTTTDGAGNYTLAIPDTFGSSITLSHTQQPATGYNDGTDAVLATTYADADAASVSFTFTDNATYNFGVVRPSTLRPDQNGQVSPGGTISYTHLFTPGTLGAVNLDVAGTYTYQVFRDVDCDGIVQTNEQVDILSSGFTVDDTWPRAQDGSLAPCTLELRVFVPQGEPSGRIDLATLSAELAYANNAGITETQTVIDTTTVTAGGRLELTKQVANVTQDPTDFSSVGEGEPGDVLEYCISYQNLGTEPLTQTRFSDPVPFFTTFQTDAYGAGQDIEWTDDGTIIYLSAPLDGDAGELSNGVVQVNIGEVGAGERGQVCYRVQIK